MANTDYPISFDQLQIVMNRLGYGLHHHDHSDPDQPCIHWRRENKGDSDFVPPGLVLEPFVTTFLPDFTTHNRPGMYYDRAYVVDLLNKILGNVQEDGVNIRAILAQLN